MQEKQISFNGIIANFCSPVSYLLILRTYPLHRMTFNQLKEYHLKTILVTLLSGKKIQGIITSHQWNKTNSAIETISIMGKWDIEPINCSDIQSIDILSE